MHPPVGRIGRHDVQVAMDEQRRSGRIRSLDPGHNARALGAGFEDLGFQACLGEQARHVLGGGPFAGTRVIARVGGVDPDQVAGQGGNFVLGCGTAGAVVGHLAIVAPSV